VLFSASVVSWEYCDDIKRKLKPIILSHRQDCWRYEVVVQLLFCGVNVMRRKLAVAKGCVLAHLCLPDALSVLCNCVKRKLKRIILGHCMMPGLLEVSKDIRSFVLLCIGRLLLLRMAVQGQEKMRRVTPTAPSPSRTWLKQTSLNNLPLLLPRHTCRALHGQEKKNK
jgi:hypothetical protein